MSEFSDRLKDIEARANAATVGPWEHHAQSRVDYQGDITDSWVEVRGDIRREGMSFTAVARTPELEPWAKDDLVEAAKDAEFIATARTDIPWLVARLREADEQYASMSVAAAGYRADADRLEGELRKAHDRLEDVLRQVSS